MQNYSVLYSLRTPFPGNLSRPRNFLSSLYLKLFFLVDVVEVHHEEIGL